MNRVVYKVLSSGIRYNSTVSCSSGLVCSWCFKHVLSAFHGAAIRRNVHNLTCSLLIFPCPVIGRGLKGQVSTFNLHDPASPGRALNRCYTSLDLYKLCSHCSPSFGGMIRTLPAEKDSGQSTTSSGSSLTPPIAL